MGLLQASRSAGLSVLFAAGLAAAQPFPDKPIRLVVPFPQGTASNFPGRTLGTALTERYKVHVPFKNLGDG